MARRKRARLNKADRLVITELKAQGKTNKAIGKIMDCNKSTVTRVVSEDRPDLLGRASTLKQRQEEAKKPLKKVDNELKYLIWVASGAIRGWVDRLLKDIESGRLG